MSSLGRSVGREQLSSASFDFDLMRGVRDPQPRARAHALESGTSTLLLR